MIETIDFSLIKPNPFQPKTRWPIAPDSVRELADDIAANGLAHYPVGRRNGNGVELAFGHRRVTAWTIARPGEPVPIDIRELTDRQMYDQLISEGAHRLDWTAIEKGERLADYMQRFGVTQTEAAKRFNLSQGAASNLISLARDLPSEAKKLVNSRALPERFARPLVSLARLDRECAIKIGQEIASVDAAEHDKRAGELITNFLGDHAHDLDNLPWPAEWKPDTATLIEKVSEQPPACDGCPAVEHALGTDYCTRPACYDAKKALWQARELLRVSKKFSVEVSPKGETVHALRVNWDNEGAAKELLADKSAERDHLRLIPFDSKRSGENYYTKSLLGSDQVLLGSTKADFAIKRQERAKSSGSAKPAPGAETPAQRAAREKREEKERQARREEKSALRRAKSDVLWLLAHTAETMAGDMIISGGVLDYCFERMKAQGYFSHQDWPEYIAYEDELKKRINAATGDMHEGRVRQAILLGQMRREIADYRPENEFDVSRDVAIVSKVIGETFRLKLPAGWHDIPIHNTDSNCWVCGKFTSLDHITKVDESQGWQTDADNKVTCSDECRTIQATRIKVTKDAKLRERAKAKTAKRGRK